jgi:glucokinase
MLADRALGVDVGGTRIRAALVDRSGGIAHRRSVATPANDGARAVVQAIAAVCREVIADAGARVALPVGLCAPGPLDARRGIALSTPTIRGFVDFPLRQALQDEVGLEVTIENDGPAAALGEWVHGAGQGTRDFVYVTVSTGIGGGVVSEGRLLRGRLGLAGHVGHIPIAAGGQVLCFCGQPGCWEAEASGSALQRKAIASGFASLEDAFARARQGDRAAVEFSETAAGQLALGLAAIAHVLSPERIVIGGGVSNAFDILAPALIARFRARVLPPFRDVELMRTQLGDNAGLLGAAQLALEPSLRA